MFWLAGWYLKAGFYFPYLVQTTKHYPVAHPFFPEFFLSPYVATVFYFLPLLVVPMLSFCGRGFVWVAAVLMALSAAVLNLHINTCNDATFVTSFWVALWLCWFTSQAGRATPHVRRHARFLAQCLIGVIFLGGTVGKLTPEYWDGEVMGRIFIVQTDQSPVGKILRHLSPELQKTAATWISRAVIGVEALLALSPFFPYRFVAVLGSAVFVVISIFSTWRIFSVLACLMGMLLACLLLEKSNNAGSQPEDQI